MAFMRTISITLAIVVSWPVLAVWTLPLTCGENCECCKSCVETSCCAEPACCTTPRNPVRAVPTCPCGDRPTGTIVLGIPQPRVEFDACILQEPRSRTEELPRTIDLIPDGVVLAPDAPVPRSDLRILDVL